MNFLIILISKIGMRILKILNRGSTFPGYFAKKLNKNIIRYFKMPKTVIFVTGTNGKSTIKTTLAQIYKELGYKVGYNKLGSNITEGVITCFMENSNLFGYIKTDVIIIEIDERYVKYVFKDITPNYFIINNISRDQPPRQAHFDFIFDEIKKGINKKIHLILNADDPIVNKFAINHKGLISYYGLAKTKYSKEQSAMKYDDNLDMIYCPVCKVKMKYDFVHYGSVGSYYCEGNHFQRPNFNYEAKLITDTSFEIDESIINMPNHFLYNIYNLSACYVTAISDGLNKEQVVKSLNNLTFKRIDNVNFLNKTCYFILSKNENSVSFNQSLDYLKKVTNPKTVVIGSERISRRYNMNDLSWLWDIEFEILNDDNIQNIICVGKFANDIAVRLKYANIDMNKVDICINSDNLIQLFTNNISSDIYCMFCFELEIKIKKILKEFI